MRCILATTAGCSTDTTFVVRKIRGCDARALPPGGVAPDMAARGPLHGKPWERDSTLAEDRIPARMRGGCCLQLNDAAADSDGNCLRSIGRAQFFHYVFDVHFHGFFRDEKLFSNIAIPVASRDLSKNLDFTPR